jgi:hypothetical protein
MNVEQAVINDGMQESFEDPIRAGVNLEQEAVKGHANVENL